MNLNDLYEMRDSRDAYERDVANSTSGFGKDSQAYRADGGANDERHDLDQKTSTWYIRLNGKLIKDKSGNPYSFRDKAAANKAASTMQAKLFNKDKEFMLTTNPNDKPQGMAEDRDYSPVAGAITRRIITQHPEVLAKYGPDIVGQAIDEVAEFVGDVDEIGSSDVSGWVSQVIRSLGRFAPVQDESVAEGHTEVKDKEGKVVSWKDDSEWHRAEKNKQGQPKDPRGVVTHLSDVARRKTAAQQGMAEAEVDSDGYSMDHADSGEYDYEGDQAKDQLNTIVRAARKLNGLLDDNENMPEWVQMKITNAADYIDTAADYIESNQEPELAEGDRVGNMDADKFDAAMARLKQLAGAGPLKTVYDKEKRVYRNIPTAVQPKK